MGFQGKTKAASSVCPENFRESLGKDVGREQETTRTMETENEDNMNSVHGRLMQVSFEDYSELIAY